MDQAISSAGDRQDRLKGVGLRFMRRLSNMLRGSASAQVYFLCLAVVGLSGSVAHAAGATARMSTARFDQRWGGWASARRLSGLGNAGLWQPQHLRAAVAGRIEPVVQPDQRQDVRWWPHGRQSRRRPSADDIVGLQYRLLGRPRCAQDRQRQPVRSGVRRRRGAVEIRRSPRQRLPAPERRSDGGTGPCTGASERQQHLHGRRQGSAALWRRCGSRCAPAVRQQCRTYRRLWRRLLVRRQGRLPGGHRLQGARGTGPQ